MKGLQTIILAAGKGTRMKSDVPKVLHTVCGKPILQYVIDIAKSVGSLKIVTVLGHKHELVRSHFSQEIDCVIQPKLLGTADAVKTTRHFFKNYSGDVLILSGDAPALTLTTVRDLIRQHRKTNAVCTFLTTDIIFPQGYGRIIRDSHNRILAIREDKDTNEEEKNIAEINVGVYCFQARPLFAALQQIKLNKKKKEFYLTDIIELFVKRGDCIETLKTADNTEGFGINTREDLAYVENVLRKRILKSFMHKGVTIVDPATTYIQHNVKIGRDTIIRPFTVIEQDVQIGRQCLIGPFARLRPGTRIANHVEIGNFTEVSRTKMGEKTLMKHFSFLGDSVVGSKVNIGAGVVTANFDGQRKNRTWIKDEAFIGSDSILVAPVKIGKKAMTGAGSVVSKGKVVPDGGMAVGVPARLMPGKKRLKII